MRVEDNVKQGEMFDSELILYVVRVISITVGRKSLIFRKHGSVPPPYCNYFSTKHSKQKKYGIQLNITLNIKCLVKYYSIISIFN